MVSEAKKVELATAAPVMWELEGPAAMNFSARVRAVALAASKDDSRAVLTALHVRANGTLRLEATDSYRLHALDVGEVLPEVDVLVPAAFLVRHLPKRIAAVETLRLTFHEGRFTIEFADEAYSCRLIGGEYPNTERLGAHVEKAKADGHKTVKAYNPRYLVDVYKAAELVDRSIPVRVTAGLDPMKPTRFVQKTSGATLTMLLMPVRTSD